MADARIRIPSDARDRLAAVAAAEGMSLRAYLVRLADTLLTPPERAVRAEQARASPHEWIGCNPTDADAANLDAELDRRLSEAVGR